MTIIHFYQSISHGKYVLSKKRCIKKMQHERMILLIFNSGSVEFNSKIQEVQFEIQEAPHQKLYNDSLVMANFMLSIGLNVKLG